MPVDKAKLLEAIDEARENAYGDDESSSLSRKRAAALEAYFGLNTDPAPEGRSQVVDRSVYETISTLLPSLVRIFASSSEEVCKFVPVGPEDEAAAEQTTALVNHVVTQMNQWEQICADWILDAMLMSNGYCMAYWDSSDRVVRESYEGQFDDQIALLHQDSDVTFLEQSKRVDEQATAEAMQAYQQAMEQYKAMAQQAQGQPLPPPPKRPGPVVVHDVTIERRENRGKVCIRVLPPEHTLVSEDTPDWTLQDCPYFEFRQQKTIAYLRSAGLDVPDDISDDDEDDETDEDWARDRFGEHAERDSDGKGAMRLVWVRSIWIEADAEDDDQSRMYYVIAVGRTILYCEAVGRIHVASMTPQPLPHRHIGMSVAETVTDLQKIRTSIKRGGLDNLYLANNGRHVVSSRVNLEDFMDARPGGLVRMLDDSLPSDGHVMPLTHPVMFDQTINSLEYFDQERQNRTGAMRGAAGLEANAMNRAAVGTTVAMQSHAAQRVEHIARMMAPAVEQLFGIVHELLLKHQNKPLTIKLQGKWVSVDPQAWRTKRDVRISVGVGAGNKESMMQQLGMLFVAQQQLAPLGLAGPQQFHATVTEMAKLAGFANPAKFWQDPAQMPPQQPQPSPEQIKVQGQLQIEQFKAQQDQQKFQAEQQIEQQRMQMQAEVDKQREEMQARQKMLEAQSKAELDRMQAEQSMRMEAVKLEFQKWQAELDAAVKLQIAQMSKPPEAQPDQRIDQLLQGIQLLMSDIQAPREIVRDPQNGRAIGVKVGDKVRKINRGPDGRPIGVQ